MQKALAGDLVVEVLVQTGLRMKYSITKSPVSSNIPPTSSATRICSSRHGHLKKENPTGLKIQYQLDISSTVISDHPKFLIRHFLLASTNLNVTFILVKIKASI